MNKNSIENVLYENGLIFPFSRLPSPDLYRMAKKTIELKENGVANADLEFRGALDIENYQLFLDLIESRQEILEEYTSLILDESYNISGSQYEIYNPPKPVKGKKKALVLLTEFPNVNGKAHTESKHFQNLLFNKGNYYSMYDYFWEASWGQLELEGVVNDWYIAENDYQYYVDMHQDSNIKNWSVTKAQALVKETVEGAINKGYDFSEFDLDQDGFIDILIIVYAGEGSNRSGKFKNMIYPHRGTLDEPVEVQDGIKAQKYILIHELPSYDLGGFCHEVGHILGLPDMYMPDFSSTVVGKWCLMGRGDYNNNGKTPSHMSAWCKVYLGWADPVKVTGKPKRYELPYVSSSEKKIYKLEVSSSDGKEYFLVENRQKIGFDKYLPGAGILVWHIDEDRFVKRFPNTNPEKYFLTLEQADGKKELEMKIVRLPNSEKNKAEINDYFGDEGDAFPGDTNNRVFNRSSNPLSNSYTDKPTGIVIKDISDSENVMSAVMGYEDSRYEIKISNSNQYKEGYKTGFQDGFKWVIEKN